ncbi:hypothetical protein [Burkholderia sp. MBR-1]|uniref:hypothetical protein n=1 Tax=Burkholderia sp. MBR-1 TaxID=2732364 RepID=UPI0015EEB1DF|nr:hypothetical protein [Burkholderia sp. MBR-1]QMI49897.1 hypothetical protein MBR110_31040 [Burkholderia sp. MBR-1]
MKRYSTSRRRPLTKAQLLPMPASQVRRLQLKHHVALATLRTGHGDVAQLGTLITVVQVTYLLDVRSGTPSSVNDVSFYRRAECALERCVARAKAGAPIALTDDERAAIEPVLALHDSQLAAMPTHRYLDAWEELQRLGPTRSPIRVTEYSDRTKS